MLKKSSAFSRKDTLIVFTYSPSGFGHLRVTNALYQEVEKNSKHVFLKSDNGAIYFLHRLISIHPFVTSIFEWGQKGIQEYIVAFLYKTFLRTTANKLLDRFINLIEQSKKQIKTVVIISTHFSLAHQISQIRKKIEKKGNVKIYLFVQVTDDSPQPIWYVPGADLTFVPSRYTKKTLLEYGKKTHKAPIIINVTPYPVSNNLTEKLQDEDFKNRLMQFDQNSNENIKIAIPISGAAVGLNYFINFIEALTNQSDRFDFHIIFKKAAYTKKFIHKLIKFKNVNLHGFKNDMTVVDEYEKEYKRVTFGYELTKPSEQSFKSLIDPDRVGGSILLFTKPIGRQEYDNINFLINHNLIPSNEDQEYLWKASVANLKINNPKGREILKKASLWRGLRLLEDPNKSIIFIFWCLRNGIFRKMGECKVGVGENYTHKDEISPDGVIKFWKETDRFIK